MSVYYTLLTNEQISLKDCVLRHCIYKGKTVRPVRIYCHSLILYIQGIYHFRSIKYVVVAIHLLQQFPPTMDLLLRSYKISPAYCTPYICALENTIFLPDKASFVTGTGIVDKFCGNLECNSMVSGKVSQDRMLQSSSSAA